METSPIKGLLRNTRAVLLFETGLPARVKKQHERLYVAGVLRKLDLIFCVLLLLGIASAELTQPEGATPTASYGADGVVVMLLTSWIQAYAIMRHTEWYDQHRRILVPLLLAARTYHQALSSIRFIHWRAVHDPAQRSLKLLIEVSSVPAAFFHTGHVLASFRSNLVASTAVQLVFMACGQPVFVELLRWAPHHSAAAALHAWLQSAYGSVLLLLSAALGPPVLVDAGPQQQQQQQLHDCQLLRMSMWLHICGQWLFALCVMRMLEAASQHEFLRRKGLAMLAELPAADPAAAAAGSAGNSTSSPSSSPSTKGGGSDTAGDADSTSAAAGMRGALVAPESKAGGGPRSSTPASSDSALRTSNVDGDRQLFSYMVSTSAQEQLHMQWQQVEQVLKQQYPETTAAQLQALADKMLSAVTGHLQRPWTGRLAAVGVHAAGVVSIMALLWFLSGQAAHAVHAVAKHQHWHGSTWTEYSQAREGQLRGLDAALSITYLAVLSVFALTGSEEQWLVRVFPLPHLAVLALTVWLQAYAALRHVAWYNHWRRRATPPYFIIRTLYHLDLWLRLVHFKATAQPHGPRHFVQLLVGISTAPMLLWHLTLLLGALPEQAALHSGVVLSCMLWQQPMFVQLLRWAPNLGPALALHKQLHGVLAGLALSVLGALPSQHPAPCSLLQLSLFLQLAGQWLLPLYVAYIIEHASRSAFLARQAVLGLAEMGREAAAAAPTGSQAPATLHQRSSSSTSSRGGSAGNSGGGSSSHGTGRGCGENASAAQPQSMDAGATSMHVQPVEQDSSQQHAQLQLAQWLSSRCPGTSNDHASQLAAHMLESLATQQTQGPLLVGMGVTAALHLPFCLLLLALVWLLCSVVAVAVDRSGAQHPWAAELCSASMTDDGPAAWY